MRNNARYWSKAGIEKYRKQIGKEILELPQGGRYRFTLQRIRELQGETSNLSRLKCLIYVMFALIYLNEEEAKFTGKEVRQLAKLASALLMVQGVLSKESKLSFLYRDLHGVLSNLHRKMGDPWMALWEQQLAFQTSSRTNNEQWYKHFSLSFGITRLGYAELANKALLQAESLSMPPAYLAQSHILRVRFLRMQSDWSGARVLISQSMKQNEISEQHRRELAWESLLVEVQSQSNLSLIVQAVQKNREHHQPSYLMDVFLRSRATRSREWIERYPTLKTLAKNPRINLKEDPVIYQISEILTNCYDVSIPYTLRFERASALLSLAPSLKSVEKELLVWAALTRWLHRTRNNALSEVIFRRYRALSSLLSAQRTEDALCLFGDLLSHQSGNLSSAA